MCDSLTETNLSHTVNGLPPVAHPTKELWAIEWQSPASCYHISSHDDGVFLSRNWMALCWKVVEALGSGTWQEEVERLEGRRTFRYDSWAHCLLHLWSESLWLCRVLIFWKVSYERVFS